MGPAEYILAAMGRVLDLAVSEVIGIRPLRNLILRDLIPLGIRSRGISDPMESDPTVYQNLGNNF